MKCPKCLHDNPADTVFCGKCGTRFDSEDRASFTRTLETSTGELTRGTVFAGRYEIIEELGAGGMGRVYRVHDTKLNEEVALKLIKPEIAAEKRVVERFRNELKTARKIRHKNVCGMFDLHEEGKTLYLTMEYVRGEDLKSLLHRTKTLPIGTALSVAHQVAEGLSEAHKLGIVHRDLKPGNIMIDKDGQAKIMDFGIARTIAGRGTTAEGAIIGTPEYMSPEQVEGRPADARSDIYSLGSILFEMLVGRPPFEGETPLSVAHKHRYELPPVPKKLVPQIPEGLNKLILRCLEKDRSKRYQTAEDLIADLAAVEQALPVTDRVLPGRKPAASRELTVKLTPKKILIPAAGLIVLVVIAILLWHPSSHKPLVSSGKPSLAVLPFENHSGDSSLEYLRDAFPDLLFTGLSSSKHLRVLRQDEVNDVLKKLNLSEAKALTSDNIKKIAQEAEVTSLLEASFVKAGANLIITAALVSGQTGETQATLSMKAQTIENILGGGLDGLVKEIKQGLNITHEQLASDIDVEIGKVMTRNPEALKYYVEAEKFHLDWKYAEAIDSLEKAVELDPEFAMAYRLLGVVYQNMRQTARSKESYEKAFRLKDRMPPREYYILQGDYYRQSEATYPKAIEMYKKVLDIYPDDYLGNHLLAYTYDLLGEWNLAIELFSKMLKSKRRDVINYVNVASGYSTLGEYEKATQTLKEFVANNPGSDRGHFSLGQYYILQRRYDLAFQQLDQAITIRSDRMAMYAGWKGDISYYKDDPEEAAKFYRTWLDNTKSDLDKQMAVWRLDCTDILKGRPEEALTLLKSYQKLIENSGSLGGLEGPAYFHKLMGFAYRVSQMLELTLEEFKKADALVADSDVPGKRECYFWEAIAQLEIGNLPEAEKLTREIDRLIPAFRRKSDSSIPYLRGRLELARKNLPNALKLLEEAVAHCRGEDRFGELEIIAFYLDSLASACFEMGDIDKSLKNYEKITLLTTGRQNWGELYAKSFYSLGKIYEQKDLKSKAAENYEKFISLWQDCEPRFRPLVEDAKKRLAAL